MEFYVVLFSLSAFCSLTRVQSVSFTFTNKCAHTVWPATLTGAGSPSLSSTGFELAPGASNSLAVPNKWSGRLWARTGCSTDAAGKFVCSTADCASGQVGCNGAGAIPPATLAELTLSGYGSQDFYDISLVDGFNLPMSLTPSSGCNVTSCPANVNSLCPPELAVTEVDGSVAACQSACMAPNEPQYCCSGNYNSPQTCKPTTYSLIFKKLCPQAYSNAYDDTTSTFTCASGSDYQITFCP